MRISNAPTKEINFALIKNVECGLCLGSVTDRIKKMKEGSAFFYGYEHKRGDNKSTFFHLICESCNPEQVKRAATEKTYRNCISCVAIPVEPREKFTLQIKNGKTTVTREFEALPSAALLSKNGLSYAAGIVMGLFMMVIITPCVESFSDTFWSRSFVALSFGTGVGMVIDRLNPDQLDLNVTSKPLAALGWSLMILHMVDSEYHNKEPFIFSAEMAHCVLAVVVGINILKILQD